MGGLGRRIGQATSQAVEGVGTASQGLGGLLSRAGSQLSGGLAAGSGAPAPAPAAAAAGGTAGAGGGGGGYAAAPNASAAPGAPAAGLGLGRVAGATLGGVSLLAGATADSVSAVAGGMAAVLGRGPGAGPGEPAGDVALIFVNALLDLVLRSGAAVDADKPELELAGHLDTIVGPRYY